MEGDKHVRFYYIRRLAGVEQQGRSVKYPWIPV